MAEGQFDELMTNNVHISHIAASWLGLGWRRLRMGSMHDFRATVLSLIVFQSGATVFCPRDGGLEVALSHLRQTAFVIYMAMNQNDQPQN